MKLSKIQIQLIAGTLLGDTAFSIDKRGSGKSYRLYFQHTNKDYFNFKVDLLHLPGRLLEVTTGYGSHAYKFLSDALTTSNFPIKRFYYTGHHSRQRNRKLLKYRTLYRFITLEALALWIADDGSLRYNNGKQFTPILSLHTQNSNLSQIKEYVKLFYRKYRCKARIYRDKKVKTFGYFLDFNTKDTLYLLNRLRDKQVKEVEYKFYFKPEGYIICP
jgi:hypothetical protein